MDNNKYIVGNSIRSESPLNKQTYSYKHVVPPNQNSTYPNIQVHRSTTPYKGNHIDQRLVREVSSRDINNNNKEIRYSNGRIVDKHPATTVNYPNTTTIRRYTDSSGKVVTTMTPDSHIKGSVKSNNQTSEENNILRDTNRQLNQSISTLNKELTQIRNKPPTYGNMGSSQKFSNDSEMDNVDYDQKKLSMSQAENQRLKSQLSDKLEQNELLKQKLHNSMYSGNQEETPSRFVSDDARRQIEQAMRVKLEDEFSHTLRNQKEKIMNLENSNELFKLDMISKDKEIQLLESSRRNEQQNYISDIENLRKKIYDDLWREYETKLNSKQEEYDMRVTNLREEVDRITQVLNEWRDKCNDIEQREIKLVNELAQKTCEESGLRKVINDLESEGYLKRDDIDKIESDIREKVNSEENLVRRVQVMETENHNILVKYENLELENGELNAKNKVLERELKRLNDEVCIIQEDLNKRVQELGDKEIKVLKLESMVKMNYNKDHSSKFLNDKTNLSPISDISNIRNGEYPNMTEIELLRNIQYYLDNNSKNRFNPNNNSPNKHRDNATNFIEEIIDKFKINQTRNESDCLNDRKMLEVLDQSNIELNVNKKELLERLEDLEKDLLYMATQLADKDNYCTIIGEENEMYKQSLLKMNEDGMRLERDLNEKESLIKTYEKYLNEDKYMRLSGDEHNNNMSVESNVIKRRYMELKEESEKLVQVNILIRQDLDALQEKCRNFETENKSLELSNQYIKKEINNIKFDGKSKEEEIKMLNADKQELYYLRAEKIRLEESSKYLQEMNSNLQTTQMKNMEEKIKLSTRDDNLRDEMFKKSSQLEAMANELDAIRRQRTSLDEELNSYRKKCDELEKCVIKAEKMTEHYEKAGKDSMDMILKDKEAQRIERDELYAQNQETCRELIALRDNYNLVVKNINDNNKTNTNMGHALEEREKIIAELQRDNQQQIETISKQNLESDQIKDSQQYYDQDKKALENQIYELREDNEQMKMKTAEIEALQSCIEEERANHRMELKKMRSETDELKKKVTYYEEIEKNYSKKFAHMANSPDLKEKNAEIAKILEEKARMDARMRELEKVKKDIGREYEDMRYKYMKLGNQNTKLKDEIARLQSIELEKMQNMDANKSDMNNMQDSLELKSRIEDLNNIEEMKKDLKEKMGNLQDKNKTLQEEILNVQLKEQSTANELRECQMEKEELEKTFKDYLELCEDEAYQSLQEHKSQRPKDDDQDKESKGHQSVNSDGLTKEQEREIKDQKNAKVFTKLHEENEMLKKKLKEVISIKRDIGCEYEELKYNEMKNENSIKKLSKQIQDFNDTLPNDASKLRINQLQIDADDYKQEISNQHAEIIELKLKVTKQIDKIQELQDVLDADENVTNTSLLGSFLLNMAGAKDRGAMDKHLFIKILAEIGYKNRPVPEEIMGDEMTYEEKLDMVNLALFQQYDDDCSGELEKPEIELLFNDACVKLGAKPISNVQLNEIIKTVDANRDGKFNVEELKEIIGIICEKLM